MKVLVDTCVWSEALRYKSPNQSLTEQLTDLIQDGRVMMIGSIRQELLSGISDTKKFDKLRDTLSAFDDIVLRTEHFIKAAEFSNMCRKKGVQGSTTDFLLCAVSVLEKLSLFTIDKDFARYRKYVPVQLL